MNTVISHQNENVKKGEKFDTHTPYKGDVFETYVIWKTIPAFVRNPPIDKSGMRPSVPEFCLRMGIDDEQILDLALIKTQTHFAERFSVHMNTLTDWNKLIAQRDMLADMRSWMSSKTKNVLFALYNAVMRTGDTNRVKLWFQIVAGWNDNESAAHLPGRVTAIDYRIIESEASISPSA